MSNFGALTLCGDANSMFIDQRICSRMENTMNLIFYQKIAET